MIDFIQAHYGHFVSAGTAAAAVHFAHEHWPEIKAAADFVWDNGIFPSAWRIIAGPSKPKTETKTT